MDNTLETLVEQFEEAEDQAEDSNGRARGQPNTIEDSVVDVVVYLTANTMAVAEWATGQGIPTVHVREYDSGVRRSVQRLSAIIFVGRTGLPRRGLENRKHHPQTNLYRLSNRRASMSSFSNLAYPKLLLFSCLGIVAALAIALVSPVWLGNAEKTQAASIKSVTSQGILPTPTPAVSQGVAVHGTHAWRHDGYTGSTVKIGIIDWDFQGFTNLMGTELPREYPHNHTGIRAVLHRRGYGQSHHRRLRRPLHGQLRELRRPRHLGG